MAKLIPDIVHNADVQYDRWARFRDYDDNKPARLSGWDESGMPWSDYEADEGLNTHGASSAKAHRDAIGYDEPIKKRKPRFDVFEVVNARHPERDEQMEAIILNSRVLDDGTIMYEVEAYDGTSERFVTRWVFPLVAGNF
jgi:hypothetical protein